MNNELMGDVIAIKEPIKMLSYEKFSIFGYKGRHYVNDPRSAIAVVLSLLVATAALASVLVKVTSVDMTAWVYNEYGDFLISISASSTSPNRFIPAYIGVFVDNTTAQFDDFIVSKNRPEKHSFH